MEKFPKEDEIVLCTVKSIVGTAVFVKIEKYNKEGTIVTSEIAPGRIRNLRDYVIPGKKIVCKILRVDEETGHIDLSLRRVSQKDRTAVLEIYEKEKNALAILKIVRKEKYEEIAEKIKEKFGNLYDFMYKSEETEFGKVGFNEEEIKKLNKILKEKKEKKIEVKMKLEISNEASNGITIIKEVLSGIKDIDIRYISAPHYLIALTGKNYKEANKMLEEASNKIIELAKEKGCKIEIKNDLK